MRRISPVFEWDKSWPRLPTFKQPYFSSFFSVSFPLKSSGSSHSTKSNGLKSLESRKKEHNQLEWMPKSDPSESGRSQPGFCKTNQTYRLWQGTRGECATYCWGIDRSIVVDHFADRAQLNRNHRALTRLLIIVFVLKFKLRTLPRVRKVYMQIGANLQWSPKKFFCLKNLSQIGGWWLKVSLNRTHSGRHRMSKKPTMKFPVGY